MSEKQSPLTRRKLLGSVGVIGVAASAGVGTWAVSSDRERQRTVVTAGGPNESDDGNSNDDGDSDEESTLDLKVDGEEGVVKVDAGTLLPGDTFESCATLSNAGNVAGTVVSMSIPGESVESAEGEDYDEETNTDESDNGELDDFLEFRASVTEKGTDKPPLFFHGGPEEYIPFRTVIERGIAPIDFTEKNGLEPIVDDREDEFCFEVRYAPDGEQGALGDSLRFDIELALSEQAQAETDSESDTEGTQGNETSSGSETSTENGTNASASGNENGNGNSPSVTFNNQYSTGQKVFVDSATLPEGGFVTIHDERVRDGGLVGSLIGVSGYLSPGTHTNVEVPLYRGVRGADFETDTIGNNASLFAIPQVDATGEKRFDFVASNGSKDGPYVKGGAVVFEEAYVVRGWKGDRGN